MAPPRNPDAACHIKPNVRARDGFRCTKCGKTNEEHLAQTGRQLEVHRVVPGSAYTVDGCVTLCRRCHGPMPKSPPRPGYWTRPFVLRVGLTLRIPASLKERFASVAQSNRRTLSAEMERAPEAYCEQHRGDLADEPDEGTPQ